MKRMICLVLALVMCFALCACGKRHSLPDFMNDTASASVAGASGTQPTAIPAPTPTLAPLPTATPAPLPTVTPAPLPTATAIPVRTPAPTPFPTYAPTPVPTATPSPYLRITKSPTGETVDEGGKAYFVAHADNNTGVTWIFTSADGGLMLFNNEISTKFPTLSVDGLWTDTLVLNNIPRDMTGWRIQARYEGLGGPMTTDAATVTVNAGSGPVVPSGPETFDSLLEKYRNVVNGTDASNYGFSYLCNYNRNLGYMLSDIDGNGVYELIIGGFGDDILYDVYTTNNGVATKILSSSERDRYYLSSMGSFYRHGSSGASSSESMLYSLNGAWLSVIESCWCSDSGDPMNPDFRHAWYADSSTTAGDVISSEEYNSYLTGYENSTYAPSLNSLWG